MGQIEDILLREIESCKKCTSMNQHLKFPKESHGNLKNNYMLVSEAPGFDSISKKNIGQEGLGNF